MRMSKLFGRTLREAPADADSTNYKLMARAGLMKKLASGIFTYTPLFWRVMRKVENIIREEMDAVGGQEINMPVVQPAELWNETGRYNELGPELVRFKDRSGRNMVLAMTHEEAVTDLVRKDTISYRQLPFMLYQIQTKFRDEPRSRGGLIRVREFTMKDAYSFHSDDQDLGSYYQEVAAAYERIYRRVGLEVRMVRSDVGMMGGAGAHEFQFVSSIGEDHLVVCEACDYAANIDTAAHTLPASTSEGASKQQEIVHTPDCRDIASVARFFGCDPAQVLKTLAFVAKGEIVLVSLRGDTELNLRRLDSLLGDTVRMASEEELVAAGLVPGYLSPQGVTGYKAFIDTIAYGESFLVAGANLKDHHVTNLRPAELTNVQVVDLSLPTQGSRCIECGGGLTVSRGVEVGNIFKLGEKYSSAMGANYLDPDGKAQSLVMGCYGIGLGRTIACIVEQHNDERGIIWPFSIAPYQVYLLAIGKQDAVKEQADSLYQQLKRAGIEVLYDDRELTPGVKFGDADLLGLPVQVVVSKRSLEAGGVEMRLRADGTGRVVPACDLLSELRTMTARTAD